MRSRSKPLMVEVVTEDAGKENKRNNVPWAASPSAAAAAGAAPSFASPRIGMAGGVKSDSGTAGAEAPFVSSKAVSGEAAKAQSEIAALLAACKSAEQPQAREAVSRLAFPGVWPGRVRLKRCVVSCLLTGCGSAGADAAIALSQLVERAL